MAKMWPTFVISSVLILIKCDIENIELSPGKIVILQSVYCWFEMWKNVWQVFLTLLSFM